MKKERPVIVWIGPDGDLIEMWHDRKRRTLGLKRDADAWAVLRREELTLTDAQWFAAPGADWVAS